jgi:uncharacterized protein (TIGR03086 family)
MIDLTPTTARTAAVAAAVTDDQLDVHTPTGQPVRGLVHHLLGLAVAFTDAAAKVTGPTTSTAPTADDGPLPDGWRQELEQRLEGLAHAWAAEGSWSGDTMVGGVALPGEIAGLVALDEVLLHGWDVARATGQSYDPTAQECEAVLPVVMPEEGRPDGSGRDGLFGTVVPVPADAPVLDRVLGLAGRDPAWTRG